MQAGQDPEEAEEAQAAGKKPQQKQALHPEARAEGNKTGQAEATGDDDSKRPKS